MARPAAPVLFGRRMKPCVTLAPAACWELVCGPVAFRYYEFRNGNHRGQIMADGAYYKSADRKSRANALNWLAAQRDRLVQSLTPERE